MSSSPRIASTRIPSLDGWRAIAISLVLYAHLQMYAGKAYWSVDWGNLGVYIFFVISGFIITRLLISEREKTGSISLAAFYKRRVLRIFPPLLAFLLGIAALTRFGLAESSPRALLFSLGFMRNYRPGPFVSLRHLWSLSVEEQFYLLWPFLFFVLSRRRRRRAVLTLLFVTLLVPLIRVGELVGLGQTDAFHFENIADGLAIGCLLAICQPELRASRWYQKFAQSPWPLLLPVLTVAGGYIGSQFFSQAFGKSLIFISAALAIDVSIQRYRTWPGRFLNSAPVAALGRISYSLYLWQQVFLLAKKGTQPFAWFPLNLALPILLAVLSFYLIEQPAIAFGRRLIARGRLVPTNPALEGTT